VTAETNKPIAAITGANGYLGSVISAGLEADGYQIRRLVRRPRPATSDHAYDIVSGCSPGELEDADVLVHCAYDFTVTTRSDVWRTNVYGTRLLLDLAVSTRVRRTIFISSMSAYAGSRQIYGRAKLASEEDVLARSMCAIRPGLVYGPGWGGMAGTLRKLTALPIVPLVGGRAHQFTLHEDDLRRVVGTLAKAQAIPKRPIGLANPTPVSFDRLLSEISRVDTGRLPRFVPIPWQPLYCALRVAELTPVALPLRADSLLGLVRSAPLVPYPEDLKELGIELRPFRL